MATKNKKPVLSKDEINFFYNKVLLHYEFDLSYNSNGYNYGNKKIKDFVHMHNIKLEYEKNIKGHKTQNRCVYHKSYINRIRESKCVAFIHHLRNAFAHGLIFKTNNQTYLIRDYDRNGKLSMYGRINENLLWKLLQLFEKTRTP